MYTNKQTMFQQQSADAASIDFVGVTTGTTDTAAFGQYPHIATADQLTKILTI